MSLAYYLASDPLTLIKRYALLLLLKIAWLVLNATSYGGLTLVLPLPLAYFEGRSALVWWPDAVLALMQVGVLVGLAWLAMLRFAPAKAAEWKLERRDSTTGVLDGSRLGRNWLATPLLMSGLVLLTSCLIGWSVDARGLSFESYISYRGEIPVLTAGGLILLGLIFGGGYISAAKAKVGGAFGVQYLAPDHPMAQRVARMAGQLGLPAPAVGIVNVPNAFAMGSSASDAAVVLGTPLIKALEPQELDAVIGHELGHIASNDMQRMQFAEGFQAMLGQVIGITTNVLVTVAARSRQEAQLGHTVGLLTRTTVFVGTELVVKGISRSREFYADAVGAALTSPDAMIGALQRLHAITAKPTRMEQNYGYLMFKGTGFGMVFSTHPSVDKRIRALKAGSHIHQLPRKAPVAP